jgi:hypothetical protein
MLKLGERSSATEEAVAPTDATDAAGDQRLAIAVAVVGLVAFFGANWLEPPAPHHSTVPFIVSLAQTAFLGFAAVGGVCLFQAERRQLGFALSAAAAWTFLGLVVACPTSGHHPFGAWWAGQLAITLPWVALSTVAYAVNSPRWQARSRG